MGRSWNTAHIIGIRAICARPTRVGLRLLAAALFSSATAALGQNVELGSGWTLARAEAPQSHGTSMCLASDGTPFSDLNYRKHWKAIVGPPAAGCAEHFIADLPGKTLYFAFDASFRWRTRETANGLLADARCPRRSYFEGYTPCTSKFFPELPGADGSAGFRALNDDELVTALKKTGAIEALEREIVAQGERAEQDRFATYMEEFQRASTLEDIASFERRYEVVDKDQLIPLLRPLKQRLLHERYVTAFTAARTPAELSNFIELYRNDDPDGLIPKAHQKIVIEQAREKAQREKEVAAKLVEARLAKRKEDQRRVAWCKQMLASAYATLDRERQIEAISGVQNFAVKRQAGQTIVLCQQVIGRGY